MSLTRRHHAQEIWRAGVDAVDSARLVRNVVHQDGDKLHVCGEQFSLHRLARIVVVGAGKAGAGMAAGLEQSLDSTVIERQVSGWVNVPADCVRPLQRIHLHAARPAGVNEPTIEGVNGSERILELVGSLTDNDLCLVLISGGGSALLPAPASGITLADKLAVTRALMHSGATIQELNTVRKRLSRIKGGGLLKAARAGRMISLIISDICHDPIDLIASGPTVFDGGTSAEAIQVLRKFFGRSPSEIPQSVWQLLEQRVATNTVNSPPVIACPNQIIGNNQTALLAAIRKAEQLGYRVQSLGTNRQGIASEVGVDLAERCLASRRESPADRVCLIGGGEPTVKLAATDKPRKGGRNQELALAAGCRWGNEDLQGMLVMSGGTDGEDGPTDAAGAYFDDEVQQRALQQNLAPDEFLAINDSYTFFDHVGALLKSGPTHTNVMDLQIGLVSGVER